jgi:hypothetical protein
MIITRTLSLALRFAQFVCAAIVLGLTAHFLHIYNKHATVSNDGPFDRLIYSAVIASISAVLALVWTVPSPNSIVHWGVDLVFAGAWLAVFGILQDWYAGFCVSVGRVMVYELCSWIVRLVEEE